MNSLSREISMTAGAIQENKYEIIVINVLCKHKTCSCGVSAGIVQKIYFLSESVISIETLSREYSSNLIMSPFLL